MAKSFRQSTLVVPARNLHLSVGSVTAAGIYAMMSSTVALGVTITATLDWLGGGGLAGGKTLLLLPGVVAVMTVVGLVAAAAPARSGLAVQPVEALRDE